jgi:pimeloyl-ACP methyl ester carboxylesterase
MKWSKKSKWIAGVVVALALAAAVSFWLRPVSYFGAYTVLREALTGVQNRTVQVEGFRLHYEAEGPANGPVVVLVHGLGGSAEDWRNLAPYLAKAGYRVYMPDLLGYGHSPMPADFSYSVRAEAGIVVGFLDALHLKQVDLGGWSMGGWIVQLVAAEHPERVRRLMLFDAAGLDVKPDWNTALFAPATPAQLDRLEALLSPHPQSIPGFVARDILRIVRQRGWVVRRAIASMLTGRDVTNSLLPKLKMPVFIAWGEEDRIFPLAQGETMHHLVSQSELDVFAGCGHLSPLHCATPMAPKVVAFLRQ